MGMRNENRWRVVTSDFVMSNTDVARCPDNGLPEYAFVGRSNVGKSSLINMLCGRRRLALTSSKPGKTLLINHFIVNGKWYLVDLPGYGYAKRNKETVRRIGGILEGYVSGRDALTCLFVLVDSRIEPQRKDIDFINRAGERGIPIAIVFTKADRPNSQEVRGNIDKMKGELLRTWEELPPVFVTSSLRKTGREEILEYIAKVNASLRRRPPSGAAPDGGPGHGGGGR